jgi:Domain of Unknown Function (DUF1080)
MRLVLGILLFASIGPAQSGFQPLFSGKNLDQWIVDTPGIWRVENGVIIGESAGLKYNDFLRTKKSYSDFVLRFSFRLKDGTGNSGVQFRSKSVPNSHEVSGYQADIGEKYWGCLYDESRRNRVLAQAPPEALARVRQNGWNDYVITARGNHITLDLNGIRTVDYRETEPGIDGAGFIALQVHSGPPLKIEFRSLEIQDLTGR